MAILLALLSALGLVAAFSIDDDVDGTTGNAIDDASDGNDPSNPNQPTSM